MGGYSAILDGLRAFRGARSRHSTTQQRSNAVQAGLTRVRGGWADGLILADLSAPCGRWTPGVCLCRGGCRRGSAMLRICLGIDMPSFFNDSARAAALVR
jgi:hypothetical protein